MKNLLLVLTFVLSLNLIASDLKLNPVQAQDLAATELQPALAAKKPWITKPAEEVRFSYPLDGQQRIELSYQAHKAESSAFWMRVNQAQLIEGVALPLSQKNALVRVDLVADASMQGLNAAIDPSDLVLVDASGRSFANGAGMDSLVSSEQFAEVREKGMVGITSAFRIKEELGAGNMLLYGTNLDSKMAREYVIQVLEKESPLVLSVQAKRDAYFAGQKAEIQATLNGLGSSDALSYQGQLIAPNGERFPLSFDAQGIAHFQPLSLGQDQGGLWEVEVQASTAQVQRNARTAFAMANASARLSGEVQLNEDKINAVIGLQVAREGRYEVRAILFGTDAQGQERAVMQSFSANQMGVGANQLTLEFDKALLDERGIQAPFHLKDLRLIDQTQMSLLHRQADALGF